MKPRPTSLTVIAWLIVGLAVVTILMGFASMSNPMTLELMRKSLLPIPVQFGMLYGGVIVNIIAGLGMLSGLAWSRPLYLGLYAVMIVINLITSPVKAMLLPGILVVAVVGYFLYRPEVNAFFKAHAAAGPSTHDAQSI